MYNTASRQQWVMSIISIIALAGIAGYFFLMKSGVSAVSAKTAAPQEGFKVAVSEAIKQVKLQAEVESSLLKELKSKSYSFNEPLVVVDPYDQSPLTAIALFTSDDPLNISIHIEGEDRLSDIDFIFDGYNTEHVIPVYGLYPDKVNNVTLTSKDKSGNTSQAKLQIKTQPLSKDLSGNIINTDLPQKDKYQGGLNFTYLGNYNKTAFDVNGDYRWFLSKNYSICTNYHFNNHYIIAKGEANYGGVLFYEVNPLGRIYSIFYAPYGAHHDIEVYKNDNLLVTGSNGETIEDFIYELNTKTGKIDNTLDLKTVFQRSRQAEPGFETKDWFHNNAVVWAQNENAVIVSGRLQSAVAKISWPEGKIEWILSPHENWLPMFDKYLLSPTGDDFEWQYNQHAPEILPDYDNNPDTIDIMLFDNGNQRFESNKELQRAIRNNEVVEPDLYSRIVQFRINEKEKTVEQLWEYGKEIGKPLYSIELGDADLLSNGNKLGVFTTGLNNSYSANFLEISQDSQIVWEAMVISKKENGSLGEYRAERMDIYNKSANNLGIGTPINNLIPKDILAEYGTD
jgi:arylsulfate sulfotransferase